MASSRQTLDEWLSALPRDRPIDVIREFDRQEEYLMTLSDFERNKVVIWMTALLNMHHKGKFQFFSYYKMGIVHGVIMGGFPTKGHNIAMNGRIQTNPAKFRCYGYCYSLGYTT